MDPSVYLNALKGTPAANTPGVAGMGNPPAPTFPAFAQNVPLPAPAAPSVQMKGAEAAAAPNIPPMPEHLPQGSMYSPSRSMWKSPEGQLYNEDGHPLVPQVPQSQ